MRVIFMFNITIINTILRFLHSTVFPIRIWNIDEYEILKCEKWQME